MRPSFAADDHRTFNRHGEAFDAGETFSGVDFDTGVDAAREFAALAPAGATPAQAALRWVIQQPGVSTVIPGARNPEQAEQNAAAAGAAPVQRRRSRGHRRPLRPPHPRPGPRPLVEAGEGRRAGGVPRRTGD